MASSLLHSSISHGIRRLDRVTDPAARCSGSISVSGLLFEKRAGASARIVLTACRTTETMAWASGRRDIASWSYGEGQVTRCR